MFEPITRLDHIMQRPMRALVVVDVGVALTDASAICMERAHDRSNVERVLGIIFTIPFDTVQDSEDLVVDLIDLTSDTPCTRQDTGKAAQRDHEMVIEVGLGSNALTSVEYTETAITLTKGSVHKRVHVVLLIRY
jgi:hypothetical protein